MALTPDEITTIERLRKSQNAFTAHDTLMLRYFKGQQRVEQLGMAIPPGMRKFLVIANWGRALCEGYDDRQQVRSLILPGEETADPRLREVWDANNLTSHLSMFNIDRMVYGRAFMSVGSNESAAARPLIRVESPREMTAEVDVRTERVVAAARFYGKASTGISPAHVTLYLPNQTVWISRGGGGRWVEDDRDPHNLGSVPIVMHLNRRMSGGWLGESQLADITGIMDAGARALTNMQFAQESHGTPDKYMTGVDTGDFIDPVTKLPIPKFEAYFNSLKLVKNPQAKVGAIAAADLKNFETALTMYRQEAVIATKLPARTFGITSTQATSEGALRAEESEFVRRVESANEHMGMSLGWVMALAMRFATGDWIEGNRVRIDWYDPSTPTIAQRMDATVKAHQSGILSRKGAWKELGWSDARIAQEEAFFAAEATDPTLERITASLMGTVDAGTDTGV